MDAEIVRATLISELTERLHPAPSSSASTRASANSKNYRPAPLACSPAKKVRRFSP
jgi:hypothetical protein